MPGPVLILLSVKMENSWLDQGRFMSAKPITSRPAKARGDGGWIFLLILGWVFLCATVALAIEAWINLQT